MGDFSKYFDYNATTPMSERARGVWAETAARHWHNPSSLYREAGEASHLLEHFREELADLFEIDEPERVIFTSGATEANNAVVRYLSQSQEGVLAFSNIEHPCVEAPAAAWIPKERYRELPADPETGAVPIDAIADTNREQPLAAVSLMAANNETGVIQPWREVAEYCRGKGITFHTDAAQWIGKLPLDGLADCDFITGSAHKFGGGKGVGFLVVPDPEDVLDFHSVVGGPQELGRRAGTENLPGVAAMVSALVEVIERSSKEARDECASHRNRFEARMEETLGCQVLGNAGERLWNTSMFVLPHSKNLKWLTRLSQRGFSVSTGSACSAGKGNPSRVMEAMGLDYAEMGRVLRVSGGWGTSGADWTALAEALESVDADLGGQ